MRIFSLVAHVTVLALLTQTAGATKVWVFGDSSVDTGWFLQPPYSGEYKFDQYYMLSPNYNDYEISKPTNNPGPMQVEELGLLLGAIGVAPANRGGTNFASGGAKNHIWNTPLNGGFPNAVPTATQISYYVGRGYGLSSDLFVISSGGNDIAFALGPLSGFTSAQQTVYIQDQAMALAQSVKNLQASGASYIIVTGLQEGFGTAESQAARQLYDTTLRSMFDSLAVSYAWADVNQVRKDIIANPVFGIVYTTTTVTACPPPNPVLNIGDAWSFLCSPKSPVIKPESFADQALFADRDGHWSAHAQKALGVYLFCLTVRTWPQLTPPPRPIAFPGFWCSDFSQFQMQSLPRLPAPSQAQAKQGAL
jgi:phospholipase/lecithinase/hemolysin